MALLLLLKQLEEKELLPDKEADQMAWVRAANQHRLISFWWTIRILHLIL